MPKPKDKKPKKDRSDFQGLPKIDFVPRKLVADGVSGKESPLEKKQIAIATFEKKMETHGSDHPLYRIAKLSKEKIEGKPSDAS